MTNQTFSLNFSILDSFYIINSTESEHYSGHFLGILALPAFVGVETIGNICNLALILHEKYGSDPMKRNMTNQLLSSILIALIFINIVSLPGILVRLLFGPLPRIYAVVTCYSVGFGYFYITLTSAEIVVLKCLFISHWSRMAAIVDEFLAKFFIIFNVILVTFLLGLFLLSGQYITLPAATYLEGVQLATNSEFEFHLLLTSL